MSAIKVTGISSNTSENDTKEFFSFCGKVTHITMADKEAVIYFERDTAAKTAMLLDKTNLNDSQVQVEIIDAPTPPEQQRSGASSPALRQEEKPYAAIAAELLASGYVLSDSALQKAIDWDKEHGLSEKFKDFLTSLESKFQIIDKAVQVDKSYGVTDYVKRYYELAENKLEQAQETSAGSKVRNFYVDLQKQVLDIHNEARRLADERKAPQDAE